ncbi:DUF3153 domain-containing protein [Micromonospora sp. DR5-3]|uniref:LppM family (lipo)protein n=1 Tax=unclassified Micromonospora TaxID=2617518 RepID=UPI0011D85EAE|nr:MULTISPECIES: DUF3153 domain-containing protein [unclassified Micromonospora]MCW3819485.1 DUF3153 domain-containing protein [Micromonospora sp. DR5-3]TYC21308.1 DUF3153 domain-containing protein [Micromonospora sp. MP36]
MNTRLPRGRPFRLAVCLALVAALTGCTQLNLGLTVTSDDTVTGQLLLTVDKAELTSVDPGPVLTPLDPRWPAFKRWRNNVPAAFAELRRSLPALPPGDETSYDNDKSYGVLISYHEKPLSHFNSAGVNLARDGDLHRFTLSLDPTKYGEKATQYDPQTQQKALQSMSIDISVTFPGRVIETNGTLVGRSVSWKLIANQPKPAELRAVAEVPTTPSAAAAPASSRSFPWLLIVGGVVVLLLVAGVVVLLLRRPRGPVAAAPTATTPAPTTPADHPGPV